MPRGGTGIRLTPTFSERNQKMSLTVTGRIGSAVSMRYLARTHKPSRGFEGRLIWGTTTTNGLREIKTGTRCAATANMSAYLQRLRTTPTSTGGNLAPPHSELSFCGRNREKSMRKVVGACRRSDI